MGIDSAIDQWFQPISDVVNSVVFLSIPLTDTLDVKLILIWLASAAIFFTVYLGFINFRCFGHALGLLFKKEENQSDDGQISRFQALTTSLSGTVGLGNIAGVAVAVSVGGPGAVFWMVVMGFLGMSSKFAEVMLAVKYRTHNDPDHPQRISGGPMYYIGKAFEKHNLIKFGPFVAGFYAVCCIMGSVGGGNMFQANQAYQQVLQVTGGAESFFADKGWLFGIILAVLVGLVIVGGLKSIAAVASRLVPIMGFIYITIGLIVIGIHYEIIPAALGSIFREAFSVDAGIGGVLGGLLVGVQRASFSNEAGLGSAAIVHATAKCKDPVSQGMVGMLGPFIDTVVICLVTALVIVVSGAHIGGEGLEGVELTSKAMASGVSWFPYVLALTVFLFAYSTLITWFYYGLKCVTFLLGEKEIVYHGFKVFFLICVILGASAELSSIIAITDGLFLTMAIPNILALYLFAPEIRKDVLDYCKKVKNSS